MIDKLKKTLLHTENYGHGKVTQVKVPHASDIVELNLKPHAEKSMVVKTAHELGTHVPQLHKLKIVKAGE